MLEKLIAKITPVQVFLSIVSGLIIGAMGIVYATWEFNDRSEARQEKKREKEKEEDALATASMVRLMWVEDLKQLKDSINTNDRLKLNAILESLAHSDSLISIVLPKVVSVASSANDRSKRAEAMVLAGQDEQDFENRIWQYLAEKDRIDSVRAKEAEIMRILREINKRQIGEYKFQDRVE